MQSSQVFHSGATVICLHSSASSGGQWRSLKERLSSHYAVEAPDLFGYGPQASGADLLDFTLERELDWLAHVFERAGERFHLVGHSYGGLIALAAAQRYRQRVQSIVVYEPAVWSVCIHSNPSHQGAKEIHAVRENTVRLVDAGDLEEAAKQFVLYWAGPPAWDGMSPNRRTMTAHAMPKVRAEFLAEVQAHPNYQSAIDAYTSIDEPVLYLTGSHTKDAVRRLTEVMTAALPKWDYRKLNGLGHMGPVSHAEMVNEQIEQVIATRDAPKKGGRN